MWEILHWIFLCYAKPNPCMHLIASFILWTMQYFMKDKFTKKDLLPALCLFSMYAAFYISPTLDHLAFQPWWVVTCCGFRNREFMIWLGGIFIGIYLSFSDIYTIYAHVITNIALMFRVRKISLKARAIVHVVCMMIYANDPRIQDIGYRDFLAGVSSVFCAIIRTPPDILSLSMIFNSFTSLSTFFLHALEPNWYKYYKNNHFRRVKHSFWFVYPIAIVLLTLGYNFLESVRSFSVFYK